MYSVVLVWFFFFFNDTATTEIYTLSLHDALPISVECPYVLDRAEATEPGLLEDMPWCLCYPQMQGIMRAPHRSEEHTSELQSRQYLVCRLLLEKKKKRTPSLRRAT